MKWDTPKICFACLTLGLGGFGAGKLSSDPESGNGGRESKERATAAPLPARPGRMDKAFGGDLRRNSSRSQDGRKEAPASLAGRLAKMEEIISAFPDDGKNDSLYERQDCLRAINA